MRLISLSKAAKVMEMGKETLLKFLDAFGVSYSYFEDSDIGLERVPL